ncbi:hypothetical protein HN51_038852 [Arachis hypogaea]|uniref:Uncharacterized protein n=1 Tax=Arachis hypogaea TaxID=3818 RepID=A0A444YGX5_ARAHY|nr:tRNA (guanine-N(7)-)-methyltransferase non-catalytic subunit [Arachis hypogaea]QHN84294.1 tRNA (guanine-N(7)-)-methyltransferase non-catalytic subunit [Arachis hypogaea]RYR01161.1 hypothetical protein Ahy_B06g080004 [Arachis hypogaea]RYR01190.1 hypothetical protein Ahy_B06g080063 [Arachis hypogaea]
MEEAEAESNRDNVEVAPAVIAVHPEQTSVVVAVGPDLRVFDLLAGSAASLVDECGAPFHKDSIRAIRFGSRRKLFVSAATTKLSRFGPRNRGAASARCRRRRG